MSYIARKRIEASLLDIIRETQNGEEGPLGNVLDFFARMAFGSPAVQEIHYRLVAVNHGDLVVEVEGDVSMILETLEQGNDCPLCDAGVINRTDEAVCCLGDCGFIYPLPPKDGG